MSTRTPFVLAIDVGTSSARALLFDSSGRRVEAVSAQERYSLPATDDGAAEADPDKLLRAVFACIDQALAKLAEQHGSIPIAAVAVSTFVGNLMGVDANGQPVTPLLTYADTRAASEVAVLRRITDEADVHQRTGCRLHTSYWPAQLRWIATARPDWLARTVQWITLGDYLQRKLLGAPGISHSVASWSGLLNRHTLQWDNALLDVLPIDRHALAPLIDLDEVGATLVAPWAKRWPALAGTRWFAAVGDGAAANLGSDCASPARVALTVGTTSAIRVVSAERVSHVPDGLWCYRVDRPRALVGGALTEGGNLFAWARRTLSLPRRLEVIERKIAALEPDGHGLTFLPLLGGERAPGWRGELRGTLAGVSLATRPEEILRAGLEGVALRIALVYSRLQPLLDENATVVASGGALLHSPSWLQIMADVLGCPVQPSPVDEASARGVVVLALAALGNAATPLSFTAPPYLPDATAHARYQEAAARQEALYAWVAEQN